ncbi:bifunctional fucokinase/fucose-1-phosphate guanylyltransferase [Marinilabilia rubra]|uniref:Bifunctional fucokinase/L-fucose-1-P-guanylyltransferase n=1 Tax=Marinilabilia rubra TaxID=2162893 RepID=A0A2U2B4I8_9BACT|nr:bifunctional fucokinase/fucose-1-phosphate guanylyltransferase [Marinilabilia rubra]PWD97973.1 bifunctional fucokinase/L-fucose-1-P-guanylyltransferase [Marinilabilia rubra]
MRESLCQKQPYICIVIIKCQVHMQTLLSLPENLVASFNEIEKSKGRQYYVDCDPEGEKVGSGGGTAWLLSRHFAESGFSDFDDYLKSENKIIIHAGGQSRRLPAYAPLGKVLTPVPVFRWSRGQSLDQNLLDLQLPLYERLMDIAPKGNHTLIASGDVLIRYNKLPAELPQADVICLGIWVDPHLASRHGVFFTPRNNPAQLDFMLQKPSHQKIEELTDSHLFMMDIGVWILSDRAVNTLMNNCSWSGIHFQNGKPSFYDLYSSFGTCLGNNPVNQSTSINDLSVAIVPLEKGEFYHFGTSEELITSTERIQNTVKDRRAILHNRVKPHPSVFVQNARTGIKWDDSHHHIWIENSIVPELWELSNHHVLTGIPENRWSLKLSEGICVDVVPVGEKQLCLRPYHIDDKFSGEAGDDQTRWLGVSLKQWMADRGISLSDAGIDSAEDVQNVRLFPVLEQEQLTEDLVNWMITNDDEGNKFSKLWTSLPRLSASGISQKTNLHRMFQQRSEFRKQNIAALLHNYKHSVFYQSDLSRLAGDFVDGKLEFPNELPKSESPYIRFRNHMLRAQIERLSGKNGGSESDKAFDVLRREIMESVNHRQVPRLNVFRDQIVWGRSPARLDLAGGWSDTPPYCMQTGGRVLNLAVNLNGQPPLQVFIRLSDKPHIVLRSVDNGGFEVVRTFADLSLKDSVGSAFSLPKAALRLAGFHPDFCGAAFNSLEEQLKNFGGGFEISLLAAIPKGSGLGTSSILAATILGVLADFCDLGWDKQAIAHRTLVLEQMLTTGGGWQDQYGGIFPGIKLLETEPGIQSQMSIRWLPDLLFTQLPYKSNWLLYYTGITRVAKNILGEIVRGMFLNQGDRLRVLDAIKDHAFDAYDALQQCDLEKTGRMIRRSWELNKALDPGTTTAEITALVDQIDDLTYGYKLLGAGGGGYLLMCAKDETAASRIRERLIGNTPNSKARFVNMELNNKGLEISRS